MNFFAKEPTLNYHIKLPPFVNTRHCTLIKKWSSRGAEEDPRRRRGEKGRKEMRGRRRNRKIGREEEQQKEEERERARGVFPSRPKNQLSHTIFAKGTTLSPTFHFFLSSTPDISITTNLWRHASPATRHKKKRGAGTMRTSSERLDYNENRVNWAHQRKKIA